jgi:hypothetical protein
MWNLSEYIHFKVEDSTGIQFPCNLEFECITSASSDDFENPGIFFLYFRGELIYIGYTENEEHVIAERVVRQLATITLRDHRLQFTSAALDKLRTEAIFSTYFNLPEPNVGNLDYVTSVNRLAFASHHWDEFKNLSTETLARFELDWHPNPKLNGATSLAELCQELKNQYKPRCNREYNHPKL